MASDWLYFNLGTMARIAGFLALILIGILWLVRRAKRKKLEKGVYREKDRK